MSYGGFLAIGTGIVAGVLAEPPGVARVTVAGDTPDGATITLPVGATLGPLREAATLTAFAVFDSAEAGTMLFQGALPGLTVAAGQYVTFPAGSYAVSAGVASDATVLTVDGAPITLGGQPLVVG